MKSWRIGAVLVFERLWEQFGIPAVIGQLLRGRRFEFPVERALFPAVLHRHDEIRYRSWFFRTGAAFSDSGHRVTGGGFRLAAEAIFAFHGESTWRLFGRLSDENDWLISTPGFLGLGKRPSRFSFIRRWGSRRSCSGDGGQWVSQLLGKKVGTGTIISRKLRKEVVQGRERYFAFQVQAVAEPLAVPMMVAEKVAVGILGCETGTSWSLTRADDSCGSQVRDQQYQA